MRRRLVRGFLFVVAVFGLGLAGAAAYGWEAMGHGAQGHRLERVQKSPQWSDGTFQNPEPIINDALQTLSALSMSDDVDPKTPVPVETPQLAAPPDSGLRITWLGHATTLVELGGRRILTDPVWSERAGPFSWVGPKRYFAPPLTVEQLGPLDAVVISHDHYDHLDQRTVQSLAPHTQRFIVPLGVGAHLEYWGIAPEKIHEVDWWQEVQLPDDVRVISTPVRHMSGRYLLDNAHTLWSGYALTGPQHRVFFSGDTGLFAALEDIGEKLGPFDVTMIEVGQYHRGWPDWHIGPEQAVLAHRKLRGRVLLPIHWGLFTLAAHTWTEPIERVRTAAQAHDVTLATPKPGQSFEPDVLLPQQQWWPALPYDDAQAHPIVSGGVTFKQP